MRLNPHKTPQSHIFAEIWLNHQRELNAKNTAFAIKPLNPGFYIFDERASLLLFINLSKRNGYFPMRQFYFC